MSRILAWRIFFMLSLMIVMTLALMPMGGSGGFSGQDKLGHLVIFASLFLIGIRAFPFLPYPWLSISVGLFLYGVLMEYLQGKTGYRSMEAWDLVADVLGLILGHFLLVFYSKKTTH
ncbi:MAG: hypothetical protein QNK31_13385 [Porticoccus sp.]|nr:hypothetical protein [Porticoccus sp.]